MKSAIAKQTDKPTYSNTCRRNNWRNYRGIVGLECHDKRCPLIMENSRKDQICAFRVMGQEEIAKRFAEATP